MCNIRGLPTRMLEVGIGSVARAFANFPERGAIDLVVEATHTLSDSGFRLRMLPRPQKSRMELWIRGTQDGGEVENSVLQS